MTNFRRQILINAFMVFDPAILVISFFLAAVRIWHLTAFSSFASFMATRVTVLNILLFVGIFYSWHAIFYAFGLYESKRLGSRKQEAADVLKATSLSTLILGLAAISFHVGAITITSVVTFWVVASLGVVFGRLLMRTFLSWVRLRGRNLHCVLIVGTNARALEFAHSMNSRPELGCQLIGFADDEWVGSSEYTENGESIVTDLDHFADFVRVRVVDEVIIALPLKSFYSKAARIVRECQEQGIIVHALSSIFDIQQGRGNSIGHDVSHVAIYTNGLFKDWPMVCKRFLDIGVSLFALILLSPLFLIVALAVKFDSPGAAFFVQERVGLGKRRFRMFKFRTMVNDAEKKQSEIENLNEAVGPVFKIKNDPRVTRIGRFLRKTSIDELPQLLNVLKGDMSLVGPRPLDIRDYNGLEEDWLRRRFSVRPGITCLWQVSGRSSLPFQEWMRLDLHYIDHWSFWLDMKVIVKTIPAVLKGVGAV